MHREHKAVVCEDSLRGLHTTQQTKTNYSNLTLTDPLNPFCIVSKMLNFSKGDMLEIKDMPTVMYV